MTWPSGFSEGSRSTTALDRTRSVRSSVDVASSYSRSFAAWVAATSVAWMLHPMATTAFCVAMSLVASASLSVRGSASLRFAARTPSIPAIVSGALMSAAIIRFPSVVRPTSIKRTRSEAEATVSK